MTGGFQPGPFQEAFQQELPPQQGFVVQQGPGGGGGGWGKKRVSKPDTWEQAHPIKAFEKLVDDAVAKQLYGDLTEAAVPVAVKAKAAAVVRKQAKSEAAIPEVQAVDWAAVQADADKVAALVMLYQQYSRKKQILAADDEWMMLGD